MRASDPLSTLAAEFEALPAGERRSVLRALAPAEREKLKALLDCLSSAPGTAATDPHEALSPCLRARLSKAGDGDAATPCATWQMTAAARRLLEQSVREVLGHDGGRANVGPEPRASLADAVLGLVSPRRWAR